MALFRSPDTSGRVTALLLRTVLYSALALGLIYVDKRYDHLGKIRQYLSVVAYPIQVAVASPFQGWAWFRESVTTRDTLRADKARLEQDLRVAQFRLQRYEALEAENIRLQSLRDNAAGVSARFVVGRIIQVDLDAFRERVLVDKGARDGVFVGQAVLDAGGVFGQVARVNQLNSEVILISDSTHALPVQINRNGLRTIAVGTGDSTLLKLPYLSTSTDVVKGDLLVTSGLGGGFPSGYPVGYVAEVKRDPAQSLADVSVKPAAALDRARELLFVWLKDSAPPTVAATRESPTVAAKPADNTAAAPAAPKPAPATAPAVNAHSATSAPSAAPMPTAASPPGPAPKPAAAPASAAKPVAARPAAQSAPAAETRP